MYTSEFDSSVTLGMVKGQAKNHPFIYSMFEQMTPLIQELMYLDPTLKKYMDEIAYDTNENHMDFDYESFVKLLKYVTETGALDITQDPAVSKTSLSEIGFAERFVKHHASDIQYLESDNAVIRLTNTQYEVVNAWLKNPNIVNVDHEILDLFRKKSMLKFNHDQKMAGMYIDRLAQTAYKATPSDHTLNTDEWSLDKKSTVRLFSKIMKSNSWGIGAAQPPLDIVYLKCNNYEIKDNENNNVASQHPLSIGKSIKLKGIYIYRTENSDGFMPVDFNSYQNWVLLSTELFDCLTFGFEQFRKNPKSENYTKHCPPIPVSVIESDPQKIDSMGLNPNDPHPLNWSEDNEIFNLTSEQREDICLWYYGWLREHANQLLIKIGLENGLIRPTQTPMLGYVAHFEEELHNGLYQNFHISHAWTNSQLQTQVDIGSSIFFDDGFHVPFYYSGSHILRGLILILQEEEVEFKFTRKGKKRTLRRKKGKLKKKKIIQPRFFEIQIDRDRLIATSQILIPQPRDPNASASGRICQPTTRIPNKGFTWVREENALENEQWFDIKTGAELKLLYPSVNYKDGYLYVQVRRMRKGSNPDGSISVKGGTTEPLKGIIRSN